MSVGLLAVEWLDSKRQLAVQLQRHATATCPVRGYVCGIWSCSEKGGSCLLSVGLQRCTCGCGVSCACSGCGMLTCMCSSSTNGSNVRSGRQLAWLLHQEASPEGHLWVPCVAGMAGGGGGCGIWDKRLYLPCRSMAPATMARGWSRLEGHAACTAVCILVQSYVFLSSGSASSLLSMQRLNALSPAWRAPWRGLSPLPCGKRAHTPV